MANFVCDSSLKPLWRRIRARQQFPKLHLALHGRLGRKKRRKTREIADAIRPQVIAETNRVAWKAPSKAKLFVSFAFFSSHRSAPAIHNLVKFYLDELRGVAFVDDRQISHLTAEFCRLNLDPACNDNATGSIVYITIERLVDYNRRFDLFFELLDESDFAEHAEQEREMSKSTLNTDETLCSPLSKSSLAALPEETRRLVRKMERDALQRRLQRRLLSHSKLGRYDRPGGHPGAGSNSIHSRSDIRKSHPLVIDLGKLPQRPGDSAHYAARIRTQMQQFKKEWGIFERINVPLDVDVRVGSDTLAAQKDLDNIMRDITPILTDEFFKAGSFLNGYRIYVSDVMARSGMANKLQLKFLPMGAIRDFDGVICRTVENAEEW